ncbi:MAG: DUF1549 and DUF1553 domain-containing protein [Planctomycetes bacterium]|nr:DUF1549 and DUF1553 domain-containing protein [Planctomycetota bacterium]
MIFRHLLAILALTAIASMATAQTPEIDAQLRDLRTAAPLALPGPAATTAVEEISINLLASKIDRHLEAFWAKNKITPTEPATDAEFLRRLTLDLGGRIPSIQEIRQFTPSNDPKKREKKVAELLTKNAYLNHFSTVLRQQWVPQTLDNPQLQFVGTQFEGWLRGRLRDNVGMDQIVREVLTAPTLFNRGRINNAPVDVNNTGFGFNQANEFKPENVAASASRLFMGIKMECAQCHDHPFAPISREQFWETAAFFAELQPAIANSTEVKLKREIKIQDPDPKKVKTVEAKFFDDSVPNWKDGVSPREVFVNWLVARDNKYFARNAVQRMWAHFLGLGFIDPIDEPGLENPDLIPDLVKELTKEFADSKYDIRFLIKAITRTKVYQLSSRQTDPSQANPRHFARMNVKALSAEQLFDSLALATGFMETNTNLQQRQFNNGPRREFLTKFASTEKMTERQTSILQALTLMNGKFLSDQTSVERSQFLAGIADAPFMDAPAKVEALFLATLSRTPSASEAERFGGYVTRGGTENNEKKALADVFWALLNSSEFILNH